MSPELLKALREFPTEGDCVEAMEKFIELSVGELKPDTEISDEEWLQVPVVLRVDALMVLATKMQEFLDTISVAPMMAQLIADVMRAEKEQAEFFDALRGGDLPKEQMN